MVSLLWLCHIIISALMLFRLFRMVCALQDGKTPLECATSEEIKRFLTAAADVGLLLVVYGSLVLINESLCISRWKRL
jgi:uncharacterized protein (UPF0264 family)